MDDSLTAFPKRMKRWTRSARETRQWFDGRFCDDLCEVILSHLPLEDKIRHECVSKQFQRCLRRRQRRLTINYTQQSGDGNRESASNLKKLIHLIHASEDEEVFAIDGPLLARVLRKFDGIDEIIVGQKYMNRDICIENMDDVLQTVIDGCHRLTSLALRCNSHEFKTELIQPFITKFGQHLRSIEFPDKYNILYRFCRLLLKSCPNLQTINGMSSRDLIGGHNRPDYYPHNEIMTKKLTKLYDYSIDRFAKESMDQFVTQLGPKLIHLSVELIPENSEEEYNLIQSLSALTNLEALSITSKLYNCSTSHHLLRCLHAIAINCWKLKSFAFNGNFRESVDANSFGDVFASFDGLTKLSFVCFGLECRTHTTSGQHFGLNCLQNCRQLTHLKLGLTAIGDQFFAGIDAIFKQLTHLEIETEADLTDRALDYISRLKNLRFLRLSRRPLMHSTLSITELGLNSLITNCHKLDAIYIPNRIVCSGDNIYNLISDNSKNVRIGYII